jgi:hypothetical protein
MGDRDLKVILKQWGLRMLRMLCLCSIKQLALKVWREIGRVVVKALC